MRLDLFSKVMLAALFLTTVPALAQSSDTTDPLYPFRQFVIKGRIDKATLLSQTSLVHMSMRKKDSVASTVFKRVQNPQLGITFEEIGDVSKTGDRDLVKDYLSRGTKTEIEHYATCLRDLAACRRIELSELNYDVQFKDISEHGGVNMAHYTLRAKRADKDLSNCEIWINLRTFHVVREIGSPAKLAVYDKNVSFDRNHGELGNDSISTHEEYRVAIKIAGEYDTVLDISDVHIERKACDAACLDTASANLN